MSEMTPEEESRNEPLVDTGELVLLIPEDSTDQRPCLCFGAWTADWCFFDLERQLIGCYAPLVSMRSSCRIHGDKLALLFFFL